MTRNRRLSNFASFYGALVDSRSDRKSETINQVRRGELDPRISNAVGDLASVLLKAQEKDELEQRLRRLESVVVGQRANPKSRFGLEHDSESLECVNPVPEGQA